MTDETSPQRDVIDVAAQSAAAGAAASDPGGDQAPLTPEELARMTDELVTAFKTVFDPEIPVDIYELGLIYRVDVSDDREVTIDMTLTAPGCPVAGDMPGWVENAARRVEGVKDVKVNMVFDPPWDMSRMSDEARLQLNML
jgi:FeS assembly SUF system protein